jgi:hypothetical protein
MSKPKYKVWSCKIVVRGDVELPSGFDFVPRRSAIGAVEAHDIEVLDCFSGWGGELTDGEEWIVDRNDMEDR